jgi:hypothetical protein
MRQGEPWDVGGGDGTRTHAPLLAKPDRAASLPAEAANGAGRGHFGVVHGCPLGTGQDRCEWHASGTVGEDDLAYGDAVGSNADCRVRRVHAKHGIVGKPRTRRGSSRWTSPIPRALPLAGGGGPGSDQASGPVWTLTPAVLWLLRHQGLSRSGIARPTAVGGSPCSSCLNDLRCSRGR